MRNTYLYSALALIDYIRLRGCARTHSELFLTQQSENKRTAPKMNNSPARKSKVREPLRGARVLLGVETTFISRAVNLYDYIRKSFSEFEEIIKSLGPNMSDKQKSVVFFN